MVASLLAATWAVGSLLEYAAVDLPTKITWFKVQAAVQVPITIALTCFILEYAWPGRWLTRRNLALLAFPGLLGIVMILTNDFHHLIWSNLSFENGSVKLQFGSGSWLLLAYSFGVLVLINLVVFGWLFWRSPQHRWPVVLMLAGQLAGRMIFLLDRTHLVQSPLPLDLLGMSVEFLMYAIVLFGFRIFDPIPLARQTAISSAGRNAGAILGGSLRTPAAAILDLEASQLRWLPPQRRFEKPSAATGWANCLGEAIPHQVDSPLYDRRGQIGRLYRCNEQNVEAQILRAAALATLK
jgi:hypothetical protein